MFYFRREQLEKTMEAMKLSADVKQRMQAKLTEDNQFMQNKIKKMSVNDFETLTIIGRGAFGEVKRNQHIVECCDLVICVD